MTLHDLGDAEVDFWGSATVQRAAWSFYFQPNGAFVWVRFRPNPAMRPASLDEVTPSSNEQFRDFMRGAKMMHTISVEYAGQGMEQMLEAAIAKLIQLSDV